MTGPKCKSTIIVATTIALTSSVSSLAIAQAQDTSRTIAKNESIFIDGKALTVTHGSAKDDVSAQITRLGAHDLGPGAIIFRANDKLYIVDAPPLPLALNDQQRSYGGLNDRQQSYGGLNDDRQRSYGGLNDDRQRSYGGLNDDRQRSYGGLNDDRQRSYGGLNDRQQSYGGMYDRQQSYGGLNDDRQRSYGGLNDRQQSYGGLNDRQQSYGGLNDRQQSYGGMYDPDYLNYKLKKTFEDVWGAAATDKK
jgi:hypothetical protein